MSSGQLLIILAVAAVTLVAVAVLRRAGIPAPVVLVVAGLIIGFLPFVPDVSLEPDVVLLGLLPLLVYDAAVTSSPTGFFRNARSIGLLAVLLVVGDRFRSGCRRALGRPPVLADIVRARHRGRPYRRVRGHQHRPPGRAAPAAAHHPGGRGAVQRRHRPGAVRRRGDAPPPPGTSLLLHTAGRSCTPTAAGAAIGLVVGIAGRWLRNRIDDPPMEIAGSILLAYAAYLPAEAVHASGVLAAVTAGLYLGWHGSGGAFSARSRLQSGAFWETLVFLVNAALFVLVGLSFHTFSTTARGPVGRLVLTGVAVVAAVIVVRLAWMWAAGWLDPARAPRPSAARRGGWRERLVLGWSGMRGAITLAALLAVPQRTTAGSPSGGPRRHHLPGIRA